MDLSLNFATDDAAPRGRKAKPAGGAGNHARRRQQPQKSSKTSGTASVSAVRSDSAASAARSPAGASLSIQPQQKAARASYSKHREVQLSSSAAGEQDGTAAKTPQSGKPQIISSLFPRLPSGSRRPEVATVGDGIEQEQHKDEDLPASVLDASNAPSMADDFDNLPLRSNIVAHLKGKMGLAHPTTIQKLAVPFLCNSATRQKDAILQAQTGSGKTLSYLLPIVEDLLRISTSISNSGKPLDRSIGTMAIILVPTRELANQIFEVASRLLAFSSETGSANHRWITPGLLTGGAHRQHEKARLRKGIPLLIATVRR